MAGALREGLPRRPRGRPPAAEPVEARHQHWQGVLVGVRDKFDSINKIELKL